MTKTANKSKQKRKERPVFWVIKDQEEAPIAICYAKTEGGALARFEEITGKDRVGFRAERMSFKNDCSVITSLW